MPCIRIRSLINISVFRIIQAFAIVNELYTLNFCPLAPIHALFKYHDKIRAVMLITTIVLPLLGDGNVGFFPFVRDADGLRAFRSFYIIAVTVFDPVINIEFLLLCCFLNLNYLVIIAVTTFISFRKIRPFQFACAICVVRFIQRDFTVFNILPVRILRIIHSSTHQLKLHTVRLIRIIIHTLPEFLAGQRDVVVDICDGIVIVLPHGVTRLYILFKDFVFQFCYAICVIFRQVRPCCLPVASRINSYRICDTGNIQPRIIAIFLALLQFQGNSLPGSFMSLIICPLLDTGKVHALPSIRKGIAGICCGFCAARFAGCHLLLVSVGNTVIHRHRLFDLIVIRGSCVAVNMIRRKICELLLSGLRTVNSDDTFIGL
ncbi:MAG: hypothetical protein BWZ04_00219 [Firmicutes bacterium ADurb.BinA205]|nr:MAG: hypothetical protein BWZ04_00219 [Firmicutes bacterium ADurb.BinA205]